MNQKISVDTSRHTHLTFQIHFYFQCWGIPILQELEADLDMSLDFPCHRLFMARLRLSLVQRQLLLAGLRLFLFGGS